MGVLAERDEFRKVLQRLGFVDVIQLAETAKAQGNQPATVPLYGLWIELNPGHSHLFAAWFNLGIERSLVGDRAGAVAAYKSALAQKPAFHQAAINLGLQYEHLGQVDAALDTWRQALAGAAEGRTLLLNHLGRVMETLKRYDEAEEFLTASLRIDPKQPDVIHHWVHLRQKMCAWPVYAETIPGLSREDLVRDTGALGALALFDGIADQIRFARHWLDKWLPPKPAVRLSPEQGYAHRRLRVGYVSSDYCLHPMSFLVAELFERHDRSQFEVYGYCASRDDGSEVRRRIIAAFDHFVPIRDMGDEAVARRIRADEIDILIELNGISLGTRMPVLRWRPAPVQLTYLGYIGPIPLDELDYILCDDYVIPEDRAAAYQPKPLYLPGLFQVNDTKLPVGPKATRAEAGLPEDRFVFCCFSNNYKITEEVFGAWMEILRRSGDAVLWLLADNAASRRNMLAAAAAAGIDPARLYFAERVSPPTYMARLALADLFLDTFPYNAGTTASDALRMGLPLVTLSGESFVSRMAGSLLRSIGLEYGIAASLDEYVEKAVTIATDPATCRAVRDTVSGDAWRRSIGDIERFVPSLEDVYRSIAKRG